MLGGIAPIIIFTFPLRPSSSLFNALSGIPVIGSTIAKDIGVPIPLYLDEKVTGICVESENKSLDIETEPQNRNDGKPAEVLQRGLNSLVAINMVAQRDSILLGVFLALNDLVFTKVVSQEYNISYLNGPTTIFGGLLHGFSAAMADNDDLVRIVLQISKANGGSTKAVESRNAVSKETLTLPNFPSSREAIT